MAHELDATHGLENSMVYVGDLPWHKYGTQIPPNVTVNEAITACPAVDFETLTVPVWYRPTENAVPREAKGHRVVVRSDSGAALGVVSSRYKPIQIRDQWKGLDPLIKAGLASIETMGSIQGGKRVWGLVKFKADEIPEWEALQNEVGEIQPYGLALDPKDGTGAALIATTTIRTVCKNTLEAGLGTSGRSVRIPHVGDVEAKIEEAAERMWGNLIATFTRLAHRYTLLKSVKLTDRQHVELVQDTVAVPPTDPSKFKTEGYFEGAVKRANARRATVYDLWFNGAGHSGDRSAWEAYNGLVEALDHNAAGAFAPGGNGRKITSMLVGQEAYLKTQVGGKLLQFAQAA